MKTLKCGALATTALGAMLFSGAANAAATPPEGYYAILTASDAAVNATSFNAAGKWSPNEAPQAGRKYFVPRGLEISTPLDTTNSYTFAGDELCISNAALRLLTGGAKNPVYFATIPNLVMDGPCSISTGAKRPGIGGKMTLRNTSDSDGRRVRLTTSMAVKKSDWVNVYTCDLAGEGGNCLMTEETAAASTGYFADYAITGSLAGYGGVFRVGSRTSLCLMGDFSNTIYVDAGGTYRTYYTRTDTQGKGQVVSQDAQSMCNFLLATGADLDLNSSNVFTASGMGILYGGSTVTLRSTAATNAIIVISGSLNLRDYDKGKVKIVCDLSCATEAMVRPLVVIKSGAKVVRRKSSTATDEEVPLTLDYFEFDFGQVVGLPDCTPQISGDPASKANERRIEVSHGGLVKLVHPGHDYDTTTYSALTTAQCGGCGSPKVPQYYWSNGRTPEAGYGYLADIDGYINIASVGNATNYVTFAGRSLALKGTSIYTGNGNSYEGLRIADLRMDGSTFQVWSGRTARIATYGLGCFTLTGGTLTLANDNTLRPYGNWFLRIASEVTGSGNATFDGYASAGAGGPRGNLEFTNLNTNWTGKLHITMPYDGRTDRGTWGFPCPSEILFARLFVQDGRNLGGPLATFTYDALRIDQMSMLHTKGNGGEIVLDQTNRGVYVQGLARFNVEGTDTLTIKNPLRLEGTLRKEGTGTLALGGALSFLDGAETPVAGTNLVVVKEGAIKALSTNALDGAAITTEEGGAIAFDLVPTNDDIAKYGLYNVKGSFEGEAVRVVLKGTSGLSGDTTVNLFTVADAETAEALREKITFVDRRGYLASTAVVAQDGVYTVQATVKAAGLMIFMR